MAEIEAQLAIWLDRPALQLEEPAVRDLLASASVLVTGAGGTIGSELCRVIASLGCRTLALLDQAENPLFDIHNEVGEIAPRLHSLPIVADIRDEDRLRRVVEPLRPTLIFHAAAHKHVPLMEANVAEAIANNVRGTRNVARIGAEVGASHLVLLSTDKAVRPTSIMGATKHAAELVVRSAARGYPGACIGVRFGNVLASRGSVVPEFLRQIDAGGPVRVTHPEMRRYFMTIRESASLIFQAAVLGSTGDVFVVDMGEPVRIVDLAAEVIRLSGQDVPVAFTGIRPGEKLYEEPFFDDAHAERIDRSRLRRARLSPLSSDVEEMLQELIAAAAGGAPDQELKSLLARCVPEYRPEGSSHPLAG